MISQIPRVGIAVFVFKNKKFIMGKRKGAHGENTWTVPGGHLEFGEKIEDAAKREIFEETGVKITNIKIVGITNDIFKKEKKHYVTIWVTSNLKSGKPKVVEPDKYLDLGWYDFKTLPKNLFLPWRQLLKSNFISEIKK